MITLLYNISNLAGIGSPLSPLKGEELSRLASIRQAWLAIEDGRILAFGQMDRLDRKALGEIREELDIKGGMVLPAWCDSHTHMVFAATRELEFIDKIRGLSYAEIAAKGGGILHSARRLNETSEEELYQLAWGRLQEAMKLGTGALEIKSGYGLTVEGELKMLRVIRRLKENAPIPIKATFLGAHAYPPPFKDDHEGYIRLIEAEMLPRIAADGLADYIDVFCEDGFFSPEETERICRAGIRFGLKPKLHANQLNLSGGTQVGVKTHAVSVDHLETMDEAAILALADSPTIGTMLPTAAFFLRMAYPPARRMIEAGAALALASDYNPGSSPSFNMNLVVAMACIQMKMLPEEAINAATINGAFAMEAAQEVGSIAIGKRANLIITQPMEHLALLPYSFGSNLISKVLINGQVV